MYGRVCHVCSIGCLPVVALGVAGLTGDFTGVRACSVRWHLVLAVFLVVIALVVVGFSRACMMLPGNVRVRP